jgi:phosphatidylserine decarboxylase
VIRYHNRVSNRVENEQVYGSQYVDLAYKNPIGFFLTKLFFVRPWLSKIMGAVENSKSSRSKILPFIAKYEIKMEDYEPQDFKNFNEFFIRKFRNGKRPFNPSAATFCAGAEARYLAFENISANFRVKVKGIDVSISELFGHTKEAHTLAQEFDGGTVIIARLCPVDYHRFHFPCNGEVITQYRVKGVLHSVNPVALAAHPEIFLVNERQVCIFKNSTFGNVAMIEVGALGVGKIVQSYADGKFNTIKFDKGDEKGYFLFGGSTVIWVLKKGAITLAQDLKTNSSNIEGSLETWIPLGDTLGEFRSDAANGYSGA